MCPARGVQYPRLRCAVPRETCINLENLGQETECVCDRGNSRIVVVAEDVHVLVFMQ